MKILPRGLSAARSVLARAFLPLVILLLTLSNTAMAGPAAEPPTAPEVHEEMWAIPSSPVPILAYLIRPVGDGPFPLAVMNHGVALDPRERTYFPPIEFRDAALWIARQGYVVVAPIRPGYGPTGIEIPERGLFGLFFSGVGKCSDAEFREAGLAVASIDKWVMEYMFTQSFIKRRDAIVVGQSGGDCACQSKSGAGAGVHWLRGRPRRSFQWQAQQQLSARPARRRRHRVRPHGSHSDAVDLCP